MLDTATKRRIDTARDILVGKVPDPKSQVEQITIALIYKFMDDMDAEAEELGGKRKFFTDDFTRFGWAKLMSPGVGGHELIGLYGEGIATMPQNPGIPALFRDIFKNAYLPYRDPETLKSFLKIINEFEYDHSERLGDAFEYLLSVLGSQGDAGQFRTPRHIIDFMVEIIAPQKGEVILDPACGTAGFLISAYKHILRANSDAKGHSTLTPDEKGRLAASFKGYDISPDMVRLSLVNLYLHGFTEPHIYEYDTLTSQDRWNEYADVILANPPFMSPKGGIKPHKRFSIQAKRSEVLFVDYMAEHLTPTGRAAIIVPEGIIFQSQTAYTELRRMLVENSLVAVVSLPAGVFQPYSGVKTSILILDKSLARQAQTVAFFKVENDGFGLGAQRRAIEKNDLPQVQTELEAYLQTLRSGKPIKELQLNCGLIVAKENVAANGDCNLSGDRYRENGIKARDWAMVRVDELCELGRGRVISKQDIEKCPGTYPVYSSQTTDSGIFGYLGSYDFDGEYVTWTTDGANAGTVFYRNGKFNCTNVCGTLKSLPDSADQLDMRFLAHVLGQVAKSYVVQVGNPKLMNKEVARIQVPLPPLDVQKEIVAEIECYQKVINGARAILDNYCPRIPVHPDWPMVELPDVCEINPETVNPEAEYPGQVINYIDISSIENGTGRFLGYTEVLSSEAPSRARRCVRVGDVLLSTVRPNLKAFTLIKEVLPRSVASTGFAVLRARTDKAVPTFVFVSVFSDFAGNQMTSMMGKGAYPSINQSDVESIRIPLPPLVIQQQIVAEIEAEQALVAANRELIARFEKKIQATLARVWGKEETTAAEG